MMMMSAPALRAAAVHASAGASPEAGDDADAIAAAAAAAGHRRHITMLRAIISERPAPENSGGRLARRILQPDRGRPGRSRALILRGRGRLATASSPNSKRRPTGLRSSGFL
jgi:hypothetical protein